jgi:hypothetical protein
MHEPDAIQLSLLDGFSRNLAERCRGWGLRGVTSEERIAKPLYGPNPVCGTPFGTPIEARQNFVGPSHLVKHPRLSKAAEY